MQKGDLVAEIKRVYSELPSTWASFKKPRTPRFLQSATALSAVSIDAMQNRSVQQDMHVFRISTHNPTPACQLLYRMVKFSCLNSLCPLYHALRNMLPDGWGEGLTRRF